MQMSCNHENFAPAVEFRLACCISNFIFINIVYPLIQQKIFYVISQPSSVKKVESTKVESTILLFIR